MKTIAYNEILYRAAEAAGRTRDNLPLAEAALLKSAFALELPRIWASEDWDDLRQPLLTVTLDSDNAFVNPYPGTPQILVANAGTAEANGTYTYNAAAARYELNDGEYAVLEISAGLWSLVYYFEPGSVGNTLYNGTAAVGAWTIDNGDGPAPTTTDATTSTTLGEVLAVFDQDPNGSTPYQRLHFHRTGDTFTVTPNRTRPQPVPDTVYVYYQTDCPDLLALDSAELAVLTVPLVFGNYLALRGAALLLAADGAAQLAGSHLGMATSQLDFERTRIQRPEWAKAS